MLASVAQAGAVFGFIVAIIVVILIHEAAHFFTARRFGIKVEEYFVGFGPRLWSFRRGDTEYGVKALPLGGYVKIAGMNPFVEPSPEEYPRTFGAKPIWQRALVIAAGPATHFLIAALFFSLWLGIEGMPVARGPVISSVQDKLAGGVSPAKMVGLRPGDRILSIDGIDNPTGLQFVDYNREHVGEPATVRVLRDGEVITVTVTPVMSNVGGDERGRLGVVLEQAREPVGAIGSITGGFKLTGQFTVRVAGSLGRVFNLARVGELVFGDAQRGVQDPVSVVGVTRIAGETARAHASDVLFLFAFFNVALAVFNLLPLLPLDGGHLVVLAVERLRGGRRIDARKLVPVSAAVAAFLIAFGVALVYLDFVKPLPSVSP